MSEIDMETLDVYADLTSMIEDTFQVDKPPNIEEEEYSDADYKKAVKKVYLEEHKGLIVTGTFYVLMILHLVIRVILFAVGIMKLDTWYVPNTIVYYLMWVLLPFILWGWSTYYDWYNFHTKKMKNLVFCIFNAGVVAMSGLYSALAPALFPLFASLPVTEEITAGMILSLLRVVILTVTILPPAFFLWYVMKQIANNVTKEKILSFKIRKKIDIRKDKEFSYDMSIVKNLQTGEKYNISEKDRYLHSLANGTTGTGKTSSCFTCSIAGDLEKIANNMKFLKKTVYSWLKKGYVRMKAPMHDDNFDIDNFEEVEYVEDISCFSKIILFFKKLIYKLIGIPFIQIRSKTGYLSELKNRVKLAGITTMAPNAAFSDEVYELAKANGIKHINRLDPMLDPNTGHLKEGFIGFNPLYINKGLNRMEWIIEVSRKAVLFADVTQAIYDSEGQSDVYFSSLNRNITTTVTMLVILTYPGLNNGKQPTAKAVQEIINDFNRAKPYRNQLVKLYGKKDANGGIVMEGGRPKLVLFQVVLDVIDSELSGSGAEKMFDQSRGLRIIINSFLTNPLIGNILCCENTIDLDEVLAKGEITLVNYALELGADSKAFGLFFLLSFINAVYRRPGTEHTRIPNFFYIDELPVLLHPRIESCFSLFRQYRVSMFVAIQSLSQMEKMKSTIFLKELLMGNCAHHFVFGRVAPAEMKMYQELAGTSHQLVIQDGIKESPLTSDTPSIMRDHRETVERDYNIFGSQIRERDFQEVTVITVRDGSPVSAFFGKVAFLGKHRRIKKSIYRVDWTPWQPDVIEESYNISSERCNHIEVGLLDAYKKETATDSFREETYGKYECKEEDIPPFVKKLKVQQKPEEGEALSKDYELSGKGTLPEREEEEKKIEDEDEEEDVIILS